MRNDSRVTKLRLNRTLPFFGKVSFYFPNNGGMMMNTEPMKQPQMEQLCEQIDTLAGKPVAGDLVQLFRNMDVSSLESYRNDLQTIYQYVQKKLA
jgi:hypothetical protein